MRTSLLVLGLVGLVLAVGLATPAHASLLPVLNVMTNQGLSTGAPSMSDWNDWDLSAGGQNNSDGNNVSKTYTTLTTGQITTTLSTTEFTSAQLACRNNRWGSGNVGNGGPWASLYDGFAFTSCNKMSVTLSNASGTPIAPNTAYQLTVYAYDGNATTGNVYFATDSAGTQFVNGTQALSTISWTNGHVFNTGDTYASLTFNVTSDSNGQIKFYDMNNGTASGNRLNGFQLASIPEPATMSLLGLGGLVTLLRRRRAA